MIISLEDLLTKLQGAEKAGGASPSEALWLKFGQQKTRKTVEYRTSADEIVHIYMDENEALVGIEIFP
jgi:hypothetical protein